MKRGRDLAGGAISSSAWSSRSAGCWWHLVMPVATRSTDVPPSTQYMFHVKRPADARNGARTCRRGSMRRTPPATGEGDGSFFALCAATPFSTTHGARGEEGAPTTCSAWQVQKADVSFPGSATRHRRLPSLCPPPRDPGGTFVSPHSAQHRDSQHDETHGGYRAERNVAGRAAAINSPHKIRGQQMANHERGRAGGNGDLMAAHAS